jgi:predicted branched-subunit amino acid permease
MFYKLAADFVVLIHFLWIIFLIFGVFLGKKQQAVKVFHISGLGFAVIIQIFGWYCPLTHLEIWLRQRHDPLFTSSGSFIVYYMEKLIYIALTPGIIFVLTLILISISAYLYSARKEK